MLILHAINVTPGGLARPDGTADYDVQISINDHMLWRGSVTRHVRAAGAAALLRRIAARMDDRKALEESLNVPPDTLANLVNLPPIKRNRRTVPRFSDLERAVDIATKTGPYDTATFLYSRFANSE